MLTSSSLASRTYTRAIEANLNSNTDKNMSDKPDGTSSSAVARETPLTLTALKTPAVDRMAFPLFYNALQSINDVGARREGAGAT